MPVYRNGEIEAAKAVRAQVEREQRSRLLQEEKRLFEYCLPHEDVERHLYRDQSGTIRKYETQGGSDDSSVRRSFYYDLSGVLRFALVEIHAVHGGQVEYRTYFNAEGVKLGEERNARASGYATPETLPSSMFVLKPDQEFGKASSCPEVKGYSRR